jgi:hypothetical protein
MTKDKKMRETFPKPPMVAYQQPPNLKRILCHAKVPTKHKRATRKLIGIKPCNTPCMICSYVKLSKEFESSQTKQKFLMKNNPIAAPKALFIKLHVQNVVIICRSKWQTTKRQN